jgi:hypothetical protein
MKTNQPNPPKNIRRNEGRESPPDLILLSECANKNSLIARHLVVSLLDLRHLKLKSCSQRSSFNKTRLMRLGTVPM